MKIAIVGSGVSGLVAAHLLNRDHDITVFEADSRAGGHANTVDVTVDGRDHAVDTGFIVYNERNYPGFCALLRELEVTTQPTDMSFSVADRASGLEFRTSNLNTIFAQRRNLVNPSFVRLLADIVRFNRAARDLAGTAAEGHEETIEAFVCRGHYSHDFFRQFVVPLGASLWSADPEAFNNFPALAYVRFLHNHGMLNAIGRPRWRTITGGSRTYVEALTARLAGRVRLSSPVHKIVTANGGHGRPHVELLTERGPERFDRAVVATHSDQALRMLADATPAERSVLGALRYQRNTTTLHTDDRMLPANPRARASWNYAISDGSCRSTVTYWMNSLQAIESCRPLLVTLNRRDEIDDRSVLAELEYAHPVFDVGAISAQRRWAEIQGRRGLYFAGAYWGNGFHEAGVQSAHTVAAAIGAAR
jgi:predicted NAD/FAD-binding protein